MFDDSSNKIKNFEEDDKDTNLLDLYIQDTSYFSPPVSPTYNNTIHSNIIQTQTKNSEEIQNLQTNDKYSSEKCYNALKMIANYMIEGMEELQKTYEFGNAVFALQYYKELLKSGIQQKYSQDMLPEHLTDFTSRNFLDNDKIKELWKNEDIIGIAELFEKFFTPNQSQSALRAYRAAIESMLEDRDKHFKHMISSTNNS